MKFYDDGDMKVTGVYTSHMERVQKPSCGFLLETKESKVYITGDLHVSLKDFPQFLYNEHVDMLITECAHFTAENLFEKLSKCRAGKVAIIHVMPIEKYDNLIKCSKNAEIKAVFPNDNDEYEINEENSFAVREEILYQPYGTEFT